MGIQNIMRYIGNFYNDLKMMNFLQENDSSILYTDNIPQEVLADV